jgi:methylated-DNA-[protein]-cysteine S-methyltransferase
MSKCCRFLFDRMSTPLGAAIVIADERGALRMFSWEEQAEAKGRAFHRTHPDATLVHDCDPFGLVSSLTRYFDGEIAILDGIPVAFSGTPFQRKVWTALRSIEGGATLSYGALARRIHEPHAVRAVGMANGRNPIGVVVPCHRVIGSDGTLTGYGGGLARKRWLLEHEARYAPFRLERTA